MVLLPPLGEESDRHAINFRRADFPLLVITERHVPGEQFSELRSFRQFEVIHSLPAERLYVEVTAGLQGRNKDGNQIYHSARPVCHIRGSDFRPINLADAASTFGGARRRYCPTAPMPAAIDAQAVRHFPTPPGSRWGVHTKLAGVLGHGGQPAWLTHVRQLRCLRTLYTLLRHYLKA